MRTTSCSLLLTLLVGAGASGCAVSAAAVADDPKSPDRTSVIARAQVWSPTKVRAVNVKQGPQGPGAFPFGATVSCTYLDKKLGGASPKFACLVGERDEIRVKFGGGNGEVFGEVLATRLLWTLGFGADRMYPVTVVCRGCPKEFSSLPQSGDTMRFEPAVIERRMPGWEWPPEGAQGWAWNELSDVDPKSAGASRAQRDALKLLAVFMQHTDSKPEQQRILCLNGTRSRSSRSCRPFLMISDVGLTFGRANRMNENAIGSVNLHAWRETPIWKDQAGCIGNLAKSMTGTLDDPPISESGRRFLANLLAQLSDRQIRDLFEVAQVRLRMRVPDDAASGAATVDEWVEAFKDKRAQIVGRKCA
jgi:hypothetical protein